MNPTLIWLSILIWIPIAIIIAFAAKRGMGEGLVEYFIGGRRMGGFISGMTYSATTYSAFMLVGLVGLTYQTGVAALGFEMTYLMFTVALLTVFGPRFWVAGKKYDYITPPELLAHRYDTPWAGTISGIISLVMLIPYGAVQLMGIGFLVNGLSDGQIPYMAGVILMGAFSGFSAIWAGMRSVSWTDAFQAITMITTSIVALFVIFFQFFGGPISFFNTITAEQPQLLKVSWNPSLFIGLALPWAFFALTNPQVSQRMFIPDKLSNLRRMIIYFSIFGFIYTLISTLFGFQAAGIIPDLQNPDKAMAVLLTKITPPLALILFIGIFAAATSTLGSIILTLSSVVSRDVLTKFSSDISEKTELWAGKITIVALVLACITFAWLQPGLIAVLSSMASGGLLVMAPALIGAFFWKEGTGPAAVISMAVGGTLTGIMYVSNYYPLGWWPSVWGFGITSFLYVMVSLLTERPENTEKFFADVNEELEKYNVK